jgi:hypothetical protein
MSWLFSLALVEEYLPAKCSVIDACAQSSSSHTRKPFCWHGKTMEHSHLSQFGETSEHLTEDHSEELLKSFLAGFHAKTFQHKGGAMDLMEREAGFGRKWQGSLAKFDPELCELKTAQHSLLEDSTSSLPTLPRWGLMLSGDVYQHPLSAHRIEEKESGLLPTPMASDWKGGTSSIRKDTGKQRLDQFRDWCKSIHGLTYPIPEHSEAMMGWPIGHTDLKPLGTDKFLSAQLTHSNCSEDK